MDPVVAQCMANPAVIDTLTEVIRSDPTFNAQLDGAIDQAALSYGGPGVLIGTAWPIIMAALMISSWRFKTSPSIRAGILLVAVILNIGDALNQSLGKTTSVFIMTGSNPHITTYKNLCIIFSQLRFGLLFWAAAYRFAAVYPSPRTRRNLVIGMAAISVGLTTLTMAIGLSELHKTETVSKTYWGVIIILPVIYVIIGMGVFTRTLRNAQKDIKSSTPSPMTHLQISNNILMGLTMVCCIVVVFVTQLLDSVENPYVIPTTLICGTFWTFLENAFELLTIFQKLQSAHSSAANQSSSRTGGKGKTGQSTKVLGGKGGMSASDLEP
ncbi:hypothetical protein HDU87_004860 [Geranomyces variabilis]|uniref:Uncharacterized protein n=1 Tax=Geranomyces variabilis TaxID=109894 RepID=A0AAD5THM8_9FUNG|nr:hypothetical protein HDU87_004860 [Geranomyces variabilis]